MKKMIVPIVLGVVILAGGSFYSGIFLAKSQLAIPKDFAGQFGEAPPDIGFQRPGGTGRSGQEFAGGFSGGKILSLDEKSLTIELPDGGSKIIYFSDSTEVTKSVIGSTTDLLVGGQISATGTTNDDGSVTAKTIQVRPEVSP